MTLAVRVLEHTDTRVLGALRCIDASTGLPLTAPIRARIRPAAAATLLRKPDGVFVVLRAAQPALAAHEAAFTAPPPLPALASVVLDIDLHDPSGQHLPRRVQLRLPKDADPARRDDPSSLFRAQQVPMYPAPAARLSANWSVLRVSLRHSPSGDALGGALLRVIDGDNTVLARALTDWRGEALVAVPGVPVTSWTAGPGPVVATTLPATLQAVYDPGTGLRVPAADLATRLAPTQVPLVDPDALEASAAALPGTSVAVVLATARQQTLTLTLATP